MPPKRKDRGGTNSEPLGSTDERGEVLVFAGDITDYWSYTQIRDWALLLPGMTHPALRLYLLLRSMLSEKRSTGLRRMSIDQLCWLMTDEKPVSPSAMYVYLATLDEAGLVTNPEGSETRVTSTGKGGIQNIFRTYQVNDLPPELHRGWRNAWDKLDAYTVDWRKNPPQPPTHRTTSTPVQNSGGRTVQVRRVETAGQIDLQNSGAPDQNSESLVQDSGSAAQDSESSLQSSDTEGLLTCGNDRPQEVSPRSSLSQAPEVTAAPSVAPRKKREKSSATPPTIPGPRSEVDEVLQVYVEALGRPVTNGTEAKLRASISELLHTLPLWWLKDRVRELPAYGTDLAKHVAMSKVPVVRPSSSSGAGSGQTLAGRCAQCSGSGWVVDEDKDVSERCSCKTRQHFTSDGRNRADEREGAS